VIGSHTSVIRLDQIVVVILAICKAVLDLALRAVLYFRRIGRASEFLAVLRGVAGIVFTGSVNSLALVPLERQGRIGNRTIGGFHKIYAFQLAGTLFGAIDDQRLVIAVLFPLGASRAKSPIGIFR
jgi:hypothetical protein